MPLKTCTKCKVEKDESEFSQKNASGRKPGLQPRCKSCCNDDVREWRGLQSADRLKELYLQRTYGVSLQWYQDQLLKGDHKCPLCSRDFVFSTQLKPDSPVVDHCHDTGKVRGVICNECNRAIGYFRNNPTACRNAAKYLES